jgi:SAM-dependent methyltransferase
MIMAKTLFATESERLPQKSCPIQVKKTVYDDIAVDYQTSKQLPFRTFIEIPSLVNLLGDIRGKKILDLACGEGFYSRRLKQMGAKTVVGVDISEEMVTLAQQQEQANPLGCTYVVGDAANLGQLGQFDIVLGSYLLNYAQTPDQLAQFCRTIFCNLKLGGYFVGFNNNPANPVSKFSTYKKYGFWKSSKSPVLTAGTPITFHILNADGTEFSFDNYYLTPETHEALFYQARFTLFEWCQPSLAEVGRQTFEPGYWDDFLNFPPLIGILARKGSELIQP